MKPDTFTQIYIQLVFSPSRRDALLIPEIRPRVFEYISGVISHLKHKPIIINGMDDHVHVFLGLNPNLSISETVKEVKRVSSAFINQNHFFADKFEWQSGYGGFSYSHSQIGKVYNYILNQAVHHKKRTFKEEYLEFLYKNDLKFEDQYLFEFFN
jgi:putative transposase